MRDRTGAAGSSPQLGPGAAFGLTSATFLVIGLGMSRETFLAWGWRMPFLLSVVLLGIGLYVRLRIAETPVFVEMVARQQRSAIPITEAFRTQLRPILLVAGALSAVFAYSYIGTVHLTSCGTAVLGLAAILTVGGLGLGPAAAWLPKLFAARYRYTASAWPTALAAILGGAVPPVVAGAMQASYGGLAIGLLLAGYGLLSVICGLALPETKHRSLSVPDSVLATTTA